MSVYAQNLLRELVALGHDVTMVSQFRGDALGRGVYGGGPPPPVPGVRVVGLEAHGEQNGGRFEDDIQAIIDTVERLHAAQPFDLLHAQYGYPPGLAVLRHAHGEYVALRDADDVWLPTALARMAALLEATPAAAFVGGNALRWYSWTHDPADAAMDYAPTIARFGLASPALLPPPQLVHLLLQDPSASPPTCSVLLRRAWLTAVAGFVDSFRTLYEDQALYAKLALRAPVLLTDEVWAHYRRHNDSACAQMYGTAAEAESRQVFLDWLAAYAPELAERVK